jgi:uncharacterized protein YuzB (UPF0349 family)
MIFEVFRAVARLTSTGEGAVEKVESLNLDWEDVDVHAYAPLSPCNSLFAGSYLYPNGGICKGGRVAGVDW